VGARHGETLADLLDAIATRDVGRALSLVDSGLARSRTSAVVVVIALTSQMFALAYARALLDEGLPASRLWKALMDFLVAGKGMAGRPYGEAVSGWVKAVNLWSAPELATACDVLLRTDMILKDTRSSSDEQILSSLILELCPREKSTSSTR
jgi:DNA polymerase III delta subunit